MPLITLVLKTCQPYDYQRNDHEQERRTKQGVNLKSRHSRSLPRICLAKICRPIPSTSQTTVANAKVAEDIVPDVGKPNTTATIGAITPVATVAVASVFSQAAVNFVRSL
jgi:hypothetical protein